MSGSDQQCVKVKSVFHPVDPSTEIVVKLRNDFIEDTSNFDLEVYKDSINSDKTTVVACKEGTFYSGSVDSLKGGVCQNFLLIVNKKKRARLLPISVCNLVEARGNDDSKMDSDQTDRVTKVALLTDKFGSKRSKRRSELNAKMRVNPEACSEQVASVISNTVVDEASLMDEDMGSTALIQLLPACNRSAISASSVYNMDALLSESERAALQDAAQYLKDNPPTETESIYSPFLVSHYKLLSKPITIDKVTLLLYGDSLLRLMKFNRGKLQWNAVCPHSKLVSSKLKKEFSEGKGVVSNRMRHKAVTHLLVAILLACDLKLNTDYLTIPGVDSKRLLQLCRLVGFSTFSSGGLMELKLPLAALPLPSRSPKKRKT